MEDFTCEDCKYLKDSKCFLVTIKVIIKMEKQCSYFEYDIPSNPSSAPFSDGRIGVKNQDD